MSVFTVSSDGLRLEIDAENPLHIRRIVHISSGREIATGTMQRFLVRTPERLSDPYFLTELASVDIAEGALSFVLTDPDEKFRLTCRIALGSEGVEWRASLEESDPTWMLEWRIENLHVRGVVVPALGGQVLTADMPAGASVAYKYPFWWQSQFAVGEIDDRDGVWIRTMDVDPRLKVLRVRRPESEPNRFTIGLGIEADGPLEGASLSASWYLDGYTGTWRAPADRHREWIRDAFDVHAYAEHPHFPPWANDVNFILEIWGMSKEAPEPRHTFEDMIERVREFAKYHDPAKTLLYLPGFAEEGIDSNAPDYNPAPKCGGREKFKVLIDEAHDLGYRVMIHTNVLALAYSHPLYERFREYQVIDCFGRLQGWGNDIDGDWLQEPFFAYMNPGFVEWTEHMKGVFEDLIDSFGIDGIFLDQTLLAFNVGRGPNFVRGMREHVQRLQKAYPRVLFAGEGFHEQNVSALPMTQIHGIDSIAGIHGLEGAREWRRVHPVSSYVFGPFTRLMAHLLTKHPTSTVYERQEEAYEELGIIPALVLYNKSHEIDVPQLQRMLERTRALDSERHNLVQAT